MRSSAPPLLIIALAACGEASSSTAPTAPLPDAALEADAFQPIDAASEREPRDAPPAPDAADEPLCSDAPPELSGADSASCYDCAVSRCVVPLCGCDYDCQRFQYLIAGCDDQPSLPAFEACLFAGQQESPALLLAHTAFNAVGGIACLIQSCASKCVPVASQPCARCRHGCCSSQLSAFSELESAQDLVWCRSHCAAQPDAGACLPQCPTSSSAASVADNLAACSKQHCESSCSW